MPLPAKKPKDYQDKICNALRMGCYVEVACVVSGISKDTFLMWMKQGRKDLVGPFANFVEAIETALAEAELKQVHNIYSAAKEDWKAASWLLERRHNDRWGRKEVHRFDHANADDKPFKTATDLTEAEIEARIKLLEKRIESK